MNGSATATEFKQATGLDRIGTRSRILYVLADAFCVSHTTVYRWATGRGPVPGHIIKLAERLRDESPPADGNYWRLAPWVEARRKAASAS